jgi:hypothetical protein
MNKYNDLEMSILSCLLLKPKLMDELIIDEKYFVKHYKLFIFMKEFYKRFGNFDITLMCSINKNRYEMMEYIIMLIDIEVTTKNFKLYQEQLIALYNEKKKEQWKIEKIYELANALLVRNIDTKEFAIKANDIYKNANEIFKEEQ